MLGSVLSTGNTVGNQAGVLPALTSSLIFILPRRPPLSSFRAEGLWQPVSCTIAVQCDWVGTGVSLCLQWYQLSGKIGKGSCLQGTSPATLTFSSSFFGLFSVDLNTVSGQRFKKGNLKKRTRWFCLFP